jgi:hypothetical protein
MNSNVDIGTLPIMEWRFSVRQIFFRYRNNRCRCRMSDIADIKIDVDAHLWGRGRDGSYKMGCLLLTSSAICLSKILPFWVSGWKCSPGILVLAANVKCKITVSNSLETNALGHTKEVDSDSQVFFFDGYTNYTCTYCSTRQHYSFLGRRQTTTVVSFLHSCNHHHGLLAFTKSGLYIYIYVYICCYCRRDEIDNYSELYNNGLTRTIASLLLDSYYDTGQRHDNRNYERCPPVSASHCSCFKKKYRPLLITIFYQKLTYRSPYLDCLEPDACSSSMGGSSVKFLLVAALICVHPIKGLGPLGRWTRCLNLLMIAQHVQDNIVKIILQA